MTDERRVPEDASVRTVELSQLVGAEAGGKNAFAGNLDLIQNVKVQLAVSLGSAELTVAELFALKEGAVVELLQASDAPLEISLDGRVIARGELVVVGDNFGVRITEIGTTS